MATNLGDQKKSPLKTTFGVKRRPFGDWFKDNWKPIIKLSVVSSIIDCKDLGLGKKGTKILIFSFLVINYIHKNKHDTLSNIKKYSINAC